MNVVFWWGSSEVSLKDLRFKEPVVHLQVEPLKTPSMQVLMVKDPATFSPEALASLEITDIDKQLKSDRKGVFVLPELLDGSSFLTRIRRQGSWNSLFWASNRIDQAWQTPHDKLLSLLKDHVTDLNLDLGIIWGRVLQDDKPLAGVALELADRGHVYYLTEQGEFIREGVTTQTGFFVYVNLPSGIHLLRGMTRDHFLPPRVLWVESGHITNVRMETSVKQAEGCVFDSQTGELLAADVRELEAEHIFTTQIPGVLDLNFLEGADPLHFEVKPHTPGYHPILLMSHRHHKSLAFPVPNQSWINQMAFQHKINQHPQLAIVIGHVAHSSFQVYKESRNGEYPDLVYFDEYESSQNHEDFLNTKQGGFIIFNVDPGVQSLVLAPNTSPDQVAMKTLVTDSGRVTVFTHSF